jgi:hypothetical protein
VSSGWPERAILSRMSHGARSRHAFTYADFLAREEASNAACRISGTAQPGEATCGGGTCRPYMNSTVFGYCFP